MGTPAKGFKPLIFKMILLDILKYRSASNFAHTFLSIIKSSHANPPEKIFFHHVSA